MAMNADTIKRYGDELYQSLIACAPIDPLTNREPDITIEDAYQIQLRMIQRRLDAGEVVIGKKIGVTSKVVMDMLGVNQPDFGHIRIWFHGNEKTIELKSLKEYLLQYRDTIISYERAIDVMYKHLMEAYSPFRMRLEIKFRPRGGISSKMVVDSDWGHLGGTDKIWQHHNADF